MRRGNGNRTGIAIIMVLLMVVSGLAILPGSGNAEDKTADVSVRAGNVLNIAIQDDIKTLNPCKASDVWTWDVMQWFYDSPIGRNMDQENMLWMAESLEYSTDNPRWANLTLKNNIKWHDGEELTGNDLVFTYNFFAGMPGYGAVVPRYMSLTMPLMWDNDSDGQTDWLGIWVDQNDPYLVHFHLSEPYAYFVSGTLSTLVLPEHIWKDHTGDDKFLWPTDPADYRKATVGTGMFMFSAWNRSQYIELDANENYFRGWPSPEHIDRVRFKIYQSTDSAVMALQSGEIDYIAWSIDPGYLPQIIENCPTITISHTDDLGFFYMAWNLRQEPFNLLPLRQAMARCTDKQTIVSRLLMNYGSVGTSVVSPANRGWSNTSVTTYAYDLDAARAILDAQGWVDTDGDGWRELPGIGDRQIVLLTPPQDYGSYLPNYGKMIADSCQEVGLNVVSKPADFGTIVTKVFDEHNFDVYILAWSISDLEPSYLQDFFTSPFDVPGGNNGIGLHNATFDAKVDVMMKEINETKRIEMNKELQESVAFNLYYNVLYYRTNLEAYRNDRYIGWFAGARGLLNKWTLWALRPYDSSHSSIGITGPDKVTDGKSVELTVKVINNFVMPAANISVSVKPSVGTMHSGNLTTNADGIAVFTYLPNFGLSAGDLLVVVTFSATANFEVYEIRDDMAFTLTVYPAQEKLAVPSIELSQLVATDADVSESGIILSVTVVDQNGAPLENANITAELGEGSIYRGPNATFTGDFTTDSNGEAVLTFGCPVIKESGEFIFRISAEHAGYEANSVTASLSYVYIPPTMSVEIAAMPEIANAGDEITVTITVSDSDTGEPLANVSISLTADEPNATFAANSGTTDVNGKFSTTMTVSEIGGEAETVRIAANANTTGYGNVSQVREITASRAESSTNVPSIAIMGLIGLVICSGAAFILTTLRKKR